MRLLETRLQWTLRKALWFAMALTCTCTSAAQLTVSAATSLMGVLRELAPVFEAQHAGNKVRLNFGPSDSLLIQIANGAPVDVLATADQNTMDRAQAQGLLQTQTRRNFAGNSLVVVQPAASTLPLRSLADLQNPSVRRFAMGSPASVPVGRYAKVALEAAGVWRALQPKAVYGLNARQVLDYVARGELEAGIVYASDVPLLRNKLKTAFALTSAQPIRYPVAVLAQTTNPELAQQWVEYLTSPAAQAVFVRHGFQP